MDKARRYWVEAGLLAAVLFVYRQVWYFDFVSYDDAYYLTMSPHVSKGFTVPGVKWALTTFYFLNWHPLTWFSYMLDIELYGPNAGGFHATNAALHALSSILLFRVLRRLTGASAPSALVAFLFAVHPLHVESVAWVSERKDVLSGVFLMLALWAYGAYARRPGLGRYLLTALLFTLGLLSKPMLVTFPFLLLLLDYWPLRRTSSWRLLAEKAPLFLLAAASSFITLKAQSPNVARLDALPLAVRVANAANSYAAYAAKTLWPANLAAFYPYPPRMSGWWMVACLLGLAAVSLAVIREGRRRPYLAVGWFWYLGALVPVIGLVQTGDQAMADRYAYIPIIGLFIMAAWGAEELASNRPELRAAVRAASAGSVLACMIVARAQAGCWRGDRELWSHAIAVTPGGNYMAEMGMGTLVLSQGKLEEAIAHYQRAAALVPLNARTHNTLGVTLMNHGHVLEAIPYLVRAVKLKPDMAEAHSNLGLALASLGDVDSAIAEHREALRLEPNSAEVRSNLAIALSRRGRSDEALALLNDVLRLDPDYADGRYNLAVALFQRGKTAEAAGQLRMALSLNPGHSDARRMLGDLERRSPRR